MKKENLIVYALIALIFIQFNVARAEILAMVIYESKTPETLKTFKLTGSREPEEGIAIIDMDPRAPSFGNILAKIPFSPDFLGGKIFYDRKLEKAYVTSRSKPLMYVFDLDNYPYRLRQFKIRNCKMAENLIFSENNLKWFLTCRMSGQVLIGDAITNEILKELNY